jgi:hypothetical protein
LIVHYFVDFCSVINKSSSPLDLVKLNGTVKLRE